MKQLLLVFISSSILGCESKDGKYLPTTNGGVINTETGIIYEAVYNVPNDVKEYGKIESVRIIDLVNQKVTIKKMSNK